MCPALDSLVDAVLLETIRVRRIRAHGVVAQPQRPVPVPDRVRRDIDIRYRGDVPSDLPLRDLVMNRIERERPLGFRLGIGVDVVSDCLADDDVLPHLGDFDGAPGLLEVTTEDAGEVRQEIASQRIVLRRGTVGAVREGTVHSLQCPGQQ
jgi:hypothetical protein